MARTAVRGPVWYAKIAESPIDHLWVAAAECGLVAVMFRQTEKTFRQYVKRLSGHEPAWSAQHTATARGQIKSYLDGQRRDFELPICWNMMTPFQQKALRQVATIPYGRLSTYQEIALALDKPKGVRAVGRANATNPLPLVIPCHRVIGSDGKLHGFGGGLETKAWLLRMEGSWLL